MRPTIPKTLLENFWLKQRWGTIIQITLHLSVSFPEFYELSVRFMALNCQLESSVVENLFLAKYIQATRRFEQHDIVVLVADIVNVIVDCKQ